MRPPEPGALVIPQRWRVNRQVEQRDVVGYGVVQDGGDAGGSVARSPSGTSRFATPATTATASSMPEKYRKRLRSTNVQGQLNEEIRRRRGSG